MPDKNDILKQIKGLKKDLVQLLEGRNAHIDFEEAIKGIPPTFYGKKVKGLPYSLWQLVEHIRLSQSDILNYLQNENYHAPNWPEDYWPKEKNPLSVTCWKQSLASFRKDRKMIRKMINDPKIDLLAPLAFAKDANVFHEILLIADHSAYHIGQIVLLRRLLGIWREK